MTNQLESSQLIPPHGDYCKLQSYQMTAIFYDATVAFCDYFTHRRSATHDQMVKATLSDKQKIAEWSVDSGASKKGQLLLDFQDFLLQKWLPLRFLNSDFLKEGGFTKRLYCTQSQMQYRSWKK